MSLLTVHSSLSTVHCSLSTVHYSHCSLFHVARWEFADWFAHCVLKWSKASDVFGATKGFYLHYHDVDPVQNARDWNVSIMKLNRKHRHLDAAAQIEFWNKIDEFCKVRKPQYLPGRWKESEML